MLELVGPECNCVASTRKGIHLFFDGAVADLRSKQFDGLDVRTGDGRGDDKQPDIIFCAPSWYDVTPTEVARYDWVALPELDACLLPPPPALLELLRSVATVKPSVAQAAGPVDASASTAPSARTEQPKPPAIKDLVLPELFAPEKPRNAGVRRLEPQPVMNDFDTIIFVDGAGPSGKQKGPGAASAAIVVYMILAPAPLNVTRTSN